MLTFAQVQGALGSWRKAVVGCFRDIGGDMNRWQARDWSAMAHAITAAEDQLELEASRKAENLALRSELQRVRRVLELELA